MNQIVNLWANKNMFFEFLTRTIGKYRCGVANIPNVRAAKPLVNPYLEHLIMT